MVKLEKLFLINNKLKKIEKLEQLTCLTMLELGDNRIRVSCTIGSRGYKILSMDVLNNGSGTLCVVCHQVKGDIHS